MAFDQFDTRELFARLIQCEAGGEGEDGINTQSYRLIKKSKEPRHRRSRLLINGIITTAL